MSTGTTVSFRTAPGPCEYLPDQLRQLRYDLIPDLQPSDYAARLEAGWRRFGFAVFRPECRSCRACESLRVPVATFQPSATQRRVWRRNRGEVRIRVGMPSWSDARRALWRSFHAHGHAVKGWPVDESDGPELMIENPFPTEEWSYSLGERLVAVSYVDALPNGLSAIYCFHDPAEGRRSLGTFNILAMVAAARERRLPHVYLGYHVAGCRSLEYKARFRPNEILGPDGMWRGAALPADGAAL